MITPQYVKYVCRKRIVLSILCQITQQLAYESILFILKLYKLRLYFGLIAYQFKAKYNIKLIRTQIDVKYNNYINLIQSVNSVPH